MLYLHYLRTFHFFIILFFNGFENFLDTEKTETFEWNLMEIFRILEGDTLSEYFAPVAYSISIRQGEPVLLFTQLYTSGLRVRSLRFAI